jgi:antitoxin HigA-1
MKATLESSGRMHSPAHPGEILKEMYIAPLGVTVTKVAEALGVTRKHVSAIVNGRAPVTPDMAVRLAGVFGTEPEIWVNLQAQYDLGSCGSRRNRRLSRCMPQPDSTP